MARYLDASVLVSTLVQDTHSPAVDHFIRNLSGELRVGAFAAAEVASAISRLVRTNTLSTDDALQRLEDFDLWRAGATFDCELVASDVDLAGRFVRRFDLMLRTPDAVHAAICQRLGLVLVTLDARLASAGRVIGLAVEIPGPPPTL